MSSFLNFQIFLLSLTVVEFAALLCKLIAFVVYQYLYNDYIHFKSGWHNIQREELQLGPVTDLRKKIMRFANLQATILWIAVSLLVLLHYINCK